MPHAVAAPDIPSSPLPAAPDDGSRDALQAHAERFRSLSQASPFGIFESDMEARILYANPRLLAIWQMPPSEALGHGWLRRVHPEDRERLLQGWRAAREAPCQFDCEYRLLMDDGSERWVLGHAAPLRDADGRIVGTVGTIQDVTHRRQLETQLRQAQKMEAVGRLAGGMAHDFNNLLTVIEAHGQFALETLPEDAAEREDLLAIRQATARASALTRQLLAFSRKQILQPRSLDLNATIAGVACMLRRLIGEDVELVTSLSGSPCPVYADPGQVEQVIMNLVVNARDAMPSGGTLRITTSERHVTPGEASVHPGLRPAHYVSLAVEDTGTGISPSVLPHLFEPFYTTKEPGRGTGLGLATVYGVVKQSGGYVQVDTTHGQGSCFTILLPYLSERPGTGAPDGDEDPLPRGHETVLLVEDDDAVRAVARRSLEQQGYRVLEASNGTDAEVAWQRESGRISILVTDAVMPGLGGRALGERLRAADPSLRILMVSGYDRDALPGGARPGSHSCMKVLPKPFTPDGLARAVREALDAH